MEMEVWDQSRQGLDTRQRHMGFILQTRGCKLLAHRMTLIHRCSVWQISELELAANV